MRPSPLRLKELFFPCVSVQALMPGNQADAALELALDGLNISFAWEPTDDGLQVSAGMKIESKQPVGEKLAKEFYCIAIEAIAKFEVVGAEHKDERAQYMRKWSAAAALIGAIREQVSLMTSRGPWGVVMLPMISMDEVVGTPPPSLPAQKTAAAKTIATAAAPKAIAKAAPTKKAVTKKVVAD